MFSENSQVEEFLQEVLEQNPSIVDLPWNMSDVDWFPGLDLKYVMYQAAGGKSGANPVEVAFAATSRRPRKDEMQRLWRTRGGGSSGFLVAVLHDGKATVAGPTQSDEPVLDADVVAVENMLSTVLEQQEHNTAVLRAQEMLDQLRDKDGNPALLNSGLFTNHELVNGVPRRKDWTVACEESEYLLDSGSGKDLFAQLGFALEPGPDSLTYLSSDGHPRAVAALLNREERFDQPLPRFNSETPVRLAQRTAKKNDVDWVIVQSGRRIRLYPTRTDQPIAGGTLTDRFLQLDLAQLSSSEAGYLKLLFSPTALAPLGSVEQILEGSRNHAVDLVERLRERVYADVIPGLSVSVANALGATTKQDLEKAYHRSLVILFRLIFLAYAEDEGLLPYRISESYRTVSLKALARELTEDPHKYDDPNQSILWERLELLWRAVDQGDSDIGVPAYNGGLFHPEGPDRRNPWSERLVLSDAELSPVLTALLVDEAAGDRGPVDFRSLDVTAFGTLYEGLLESELSLAEQDLVVAKIKKKETFVPAPAGTVDPLVREGEIYFHSASGERKATGSYFTPDFAVDYLLDQALEPALQAHLEEVAHLVESEAPREQVAEKLFDFRVIDPSMGSAHFLVAAVDRIGKAFLDFLTDHDLPPVTRELETLQDQAQMALAEIGIDPMKQQSQSSAVNISLDRILNRQVARRCIYGIDINLMAVELARLAIWIRTFVPGLPMTSLSQRLKHGNALVGISSTAQVIEVLDPAGAGTTFSYVRSRVETELADAAADLRKLGMAAEGTIAEVQESQQEYLRIWEELSDLRQLFDLALSVQIGAEERRVLAEYDPAKFTITEDARKILDELVCLHLPLEFPEVMLRDNPGFDVVLGNPPWEKVKLEEHTWWTIRIPGLRSMSQQEKNQTIEHYQETRPDLYEAYLQEKEETEKLRQVMKHSPYPLGAGDSDLYKFFCWRDWDLLRRDGRIGVVLPRAALSGSGTAQWRQEILEQGMFEDVCTIVNNGGWLFEGVHPQYTVALATISRGNSDGVSFHGPYFDRAAFEAGAQSAATGGTVVRATSEEFLNWSPKAVFPLLPSPDSAKVFAEMRKSRIFAEAEVSSDFRFATELHTTQQKKLYDFDFSSSERDLEVWTGASFNLWTPGTGAIYARAWYEEIETFLQEKRVKQIRRSDGAFGGLSRDWAQDPQTLPMKHPRIAFRDVARATDTRTFLTCLLPADIALVEKAPYLFNATGDKESESLLLGVISSRPFDWNARRSVENKVSKEVLYSLPFPAVNLNGILERKLIENSGRLAAVDERFSAWAAEVGVEVGTVNEESVKQELIAENDAIVARLYGLNRDHLSTIFETFHRGWEYQDDLQRTLRYFDEWEENDD